VDVAEQREGEPARASERLMAERAVAADREQGGAARLQFASDLVQAAELGRSDTAEVVAVEHQHDVSPSEVGERDGAATCGRQREFGGGLAIFEGGHRAESIESTRPAPQHRCSPLMPTLRASRPAGEVTRSANI